MATKLSAQNKKPQNTENKSTVKQNKKNKEFKALEYSTSKSHIYACFEQPQTIEIIKYLSMPAPNKLFFDSGAKNFGKNLSQNQKANIIEKRSKQFKFQRIYQRQEKFVIIYCYMAQKYAFSQQINFIIAQLFQGYSQSVFIYGTEQSKKDKILIGQSQNAGFLLTTLSQIFQYCHQKQIQDEVTIKISCSMFKDGKFTDPFNCAENHHNNSQNDLACPTTLNNNNNQQVNYSDPFSTSNPNKSPPTTYLEQQFEHLLCQDSIQNKYLLGCPQIIVRNMRTSLKIINLITKKIQQRRDSKEQNTENLIFTIKLQIDTAYDKYTTGEVYEYSIPKLHIVKLGNPSIDNTLNGVNKNNQWFINLFNFLQNQVVLQRSSSKKVNQSATISNSQLLLQQIQNPQFKQLNQILSNNTTNNYNNSNQLPLKASNITGNNLASQSSSSSSASKDLFTEYIKNVVMKNVADIHCFTSINNKMTSNQCLTAFIFNNYLTAYQTKPLKRILNINQLKNQKINYQEQLLNIFQVRQVQNNRQREIGEKYKVKYQLGVGDGINGSGSNNSGGNMNNGNLAKSYSNMLLQQQLNNSNANTSSLNMNKQTQPQHRSNMNKNRSKQSHSLVKQQKQHNKKSANNSNNLNSLNNLNSMNTNNNSNQFIDMSLIKQTIKAILPSFLFNIQTNINSVNAVNKQEQSSNINTSNFNNSTLMSLQYCPEIQIKILLLTYITNIKKLTNCCNLVQYQYAQILSHGCQKLSKYIFNEEIEQFYYAKKISLEPSLDLRLALCTLKQQKLSLLEQETQLTKKILYQIKKINYQLQLLKSINGRQQHQELFKIKRNKLNTFVRFKEILSKMFQYYSTMTFHYIYEDNKKLIEQLQKKKKQVQEQYEKKNSLSKKDVDYSQIMKNIKKGFNKRINQKRKTHASNQQQKDKQITILQQQDKQQQPRQQQTLNNSNNLQNLQNLQNTQNIHNNQRQIIQQQQQSVQNNNCNSEWLDASLLKKDKSMIPSSSITFNDNEISRQQQNNKSSKSPGKLNKQNKFNASPSNSNGIKYKMRKKVDQLDNMFTNTNVGVVRPQFTRKNY